jgi:hypothetical protein
MALNDSDALRVAQEVLLRKELDAAGSRGGSPVVHPDAVFWLAEKVIELLKREKAGFFNAITLSIRAIEDQVAQLDKWAKENADGDYSAPELIPSTQQLREVQEKIQKINKWLLERTTVYNGCDCTIYGEFPQECLRIKDSKELSAGRTG